MIHVRIDNHHSTAVDIYVNISPKNMIKTSSPISLNNSEHIYNHLFDTKNNSLRQSKIIKNQIDNNLSLKNKKNYTIEQILNNVENIQKEYEQIINNQTTSSSSTCFFTFKKLTKILKNIRTIKTKTNNESIKNNYLDNKSPFIFGGETLQWIALPQDDQHIYENEFIS